MKVLKNSKKAVETVACSTSSQSISCSPKLSLDKSMVHVFYFLNTLCKMKNTEVMRRVSSQNLMHRYSMLDLSGEGEGYIGGSVAEWFRALVL